MQSINCKCEGHRGTAHNHITLSSMSMSTHAYVCALLFSNVPDLLLWTANEKLSKEEDPPLFSVESMGYLSKGALSVI